MNKKIWIIKAGSQMVCEGGPVLILSWMKQVRVLREKYKIDVIWVTSGAISSAQERTNFSGPKRSLSQKQALSAIGQPLVMDIYNLALSRSGLLGAQVLLTAGDIRDRTRRRNLQTSLGQLLKWQTVPVLNENDAVSTEEIEFGDNDSLSAKIALMMSAEKLILLTDVDGLFESDPKKYPNAQLIEFKSRVTAKDLAAHKLSAKSARGTGGIYSKLLAAQAAQKAKIETHLVRGDARNVLLEIAEAKSIGTLFGVTK
jgi:glutamate 5-kinase